MISNLEKVSESVEAGEQQLEMDRFLLDEQDYILDSKPAAHELSKATETGKNFPVGSHLKGRRQVLVTRRLGSKEQVKYVDKIAETYKMY